MNEIFIQNILSFTMAIFVGVVIGSGVNNWYMSSKKVRSEILNEEKINIKQEFRDRYKLVVKYTNQNLEDSRLGTIKNARILSTAHLYISPSSEVSILGDTYIFKPFKKESWLILNPLTTTTFFKISLFLSFFKITIIKWS